MALTLFGRRLASRVACALLAATVTYGSQSAPDAPPASPPQTGGWRLATEGSAYLRMHATNPVAWYPWGEAAFARARELDQPILLSIGYASCHWCHVMRRESFEDPKLAEYLNANFVAIKVDREELPHVDDAYMSAVQAMRRDGGWPLNVFLFANGKPFFGDTYFPPVGIPGRPGFREVLEIIVDIWTTDRGRLSAQADSVTASLTRKESTGVALARREQLDAAVARLVALHDAEHGGVGTGAKFPMPEAVLLFLALDALENRADLRALALKSLAAMAAGGLRDAVGGGFHRYCVDRAWTVPHFEKMLYSQALNTDAFLEAYRLTGDAELAAVARETLDALLRDFALESGGFAASFDADIGEEEGTYYLWTPPQVAAALGDAERAKWMSRALGITELGNFEGGRSVPARRVELAALAQELGKDAAALAQEFVAARESLRAARARRPAPLRDDKVLLGWNAMAVSTLARGATLLNEPRYLALAERVHAVLNQQLAPDGKFLRRSVAGQADHPAQLVDAALLAKACLDLYEASFAAEHVARARALVDRIVALYGPTPKPAEVAAGAQAPDMFFDTVADVQLYLPRSASALDNAEPSGNSVLALVLLRLHALTGETRYRTLADGIIEAGLRSVRQFPHGAPWMSYAALASLTPSLEVAIAGEFAAPETQSFLGAARASRQPFLVVAHRAPGELGARAAQIIPLLEHREPIAGKPAAYLCRGGACRAPITDPALVPAALDAERKSVSPTHSPTD
ncbi:MAG: thioredoxin domain-containing protein [Planctomycetota bacterium]